MDGHQFIPMGYTAMIDLSGMFEAACGAVTVITVGSLWFCDRVSKREAALDEAEAKRAAELTEPKPDPEALRAAIQKKRELLTWRKSKYVEAWERTKDEQHWELVKQVDKILADLADEEARIPVPIGRSHIDRRCGRLLDDSQAQASAADYAALRNAAK